MIQYHIEEDPLTVREYQSLRQTTNWHEVPDDDVEKAVRGDLYTVKVYVGDHIIGMGRVVGDGGIYFYIQDVIVHPDFQNKGVGGMIMGRIENWLEEHATENSFIGLMAARGVERFYEQYGYKRRPDDRPGMSKK